MTDPTRLAHDIRDRLHAMLGAPSDFVPLHKPEFHGEEETLVADCVRSGWVSSVGKYVDRFEAEIAAACGTAHGVAVVNGTAALEVALRVAGVSAGDEVLMPSLTFVATANATHHLGAVPHFVDVEERTLGLDPAALRTHLDATTERRGEGLFNRETGRRISAILPMHAFGHPVDIDGLAEVAQDAGLVIVEDAAEALGSRYKGKRCGSFGRVSALSFNGNKVLTTGGGGAIVTDDPELAARAKHLTTTAKAAHRWAFEHDEIGYNYRMPNLNAALGVAQLAQLDTRLAQKRRLAEAYLASFADHPDLEVLREPEGAESNYWLNAFVLKPHAAAARDTLLGVLNDAGLMARPVWEPLHTLPIYADAPRAALPLTEDLAARVVNVPSSAYLGATLA
ncbi:LegC family aminotransferase [Roseivivax sp. GX 12232]|uniref:LegC family aminotransferase n=1 Tax=Roseivivax sp. GX 12232 TaxID=2900547 RepID=UPI001E5BB428|nr:LegC family aminotransferase [Roseivivax sp. GX 12232]MCE0503743.1 LegC family aminotransferase [Roseivivax sp. GX 12232]